MPGKPTSGSDIFFWRFCSHRCYINDALINPNVPYGCFRMLSGRHHLTGKGRRCTNQVIVIIDNGLDVAHSFLKKEERGHDGLSLVVENLSVASGKIFS
jgi:hypothetical protein